MPTPPATDSLEPSIATETVQSLRDFLHAAIPNIAAALREREKTWSDETQWERGADGHFRERKKRVFGLWLLSTDETLRTQPGYANCVELLNADPVIGPHLRCLVGTQNGSRRFEIDDILISMTSAMFDGGGRLIFTDKQFDSEWRIWAEFFCGREVVWKMVAPLPSLKVPSFPLRLNHDLVLDHLTDDEVSRCWHLGILRPESPRFPLIYGETAVGIRRTISLAKILRKENESHAGANDESEGNFGNRPILRDDLVVDDVLSGLRLCMSTDIRTAGHASWADSPLLGDSTTYRVLGQWPYGGGCNLSDTDVARLLDLWQLLQEEGAARFRFSVHRFNLAFNRGLLDDRLVDLVIAAEALLLSENKPKDRGELRFRFSLRAAKFIEHPTYNEYEVFRIMRQAYDNRSAIVHGGSSGDTRLPDNNSANLSIFISTIEELVRLGLCKALAMRAEGKQLGKSEYWDSLVLSKLVKLRAP